MSESKGVSGSATHVEADVLIACYNCSDGHGKVSIPQVENALSRINREVGKIPSKLTQQDLDNMMKAGLVPDTSTILERIFSGSR